MRSFLLVPLVQIQFKIFRSTEREGEERERPARPQRPSRLCSSCEKRPKKRRRRRRRRVKTMDEKRVRKNAGMPRKNRLALRMRFPSLNKFEELFAKIHDVS